MMILVMAWKRPSAILSITVELWKKHFKEFLDPIDPCCYELEGEDSDEDLLPWVDEICPKMIKAVVSLSC